VRLVGEPLHVLAGQVPVAGDHLGAVELGDLGVAVAARPARGAGEGALGEAERRGGGHRRRDRDLRHVLHAARHDQVGRPGQDGLRGEVHGLLRGAALPVDGDAGDLLGEAGGEPAGAGDVAGLRADGVDAAEHDVLDGGRVDLRPVHEGGEDVRAEVGGVHPGEPAAAPPDGGADGVDDVCLGHGVFSFVRVRRAGA
jgi:hypothetical protein